MKIHQSMDINILFSLLNMKMRNEQTDLTMACQRLQLDETTVTARVQQIGWYYDNVCRQFKTI